MVRGLFLLCFLTFGLVAEVYQPQNQYSQPPSYNPPPYQGGYGYNQTAQNQQVRKLPNSDAKQFIIFYGARARKLYAIHRTLFKKGYNYQTIFELDLDRRFKDSLIREIQSFQSQAYFETRQVDFETLKKGDTLKGNTCIDDACYIGGGKITVVEVLYNKKIDGTGTKPANTQFLAFGSNLDYYSYDFFIVHEIVKPTDYIQIWQVYLGNSSKVHPYKRMTFTTQTNFLPYQGPNLPYSYPAKMDGSFASFNVSMSRHLYFEELKDEF